MVLSQFELTALTPEQFHYDWQGPEKPGIDQVDDGRIQEVIG